jgi:hypothetical protein
MQNLFPGAPRFGEIMEPHSIPLPPLVPERPAMPMMRAINNPLPPTKTEETDAEIVLSLLNELQEKMANMGDKVDQIHIEEKKHYESLRRGLKRIKDEKPPTVTMPEIDYCPQKIVFAGLPKPLCICNYCLKRISCFDGADNS